MCTVLGKFEIFSFFLNKALMFLILVLILICANQCFGLYSICRSLSSISVCIIHGFDILYIYIYICYVWCVQYLVSLIFIWTEILCRLSAGRKLISTAQTVRSLTSGIPRINQDVLPRLSVEGACLIRGLLSNNEVSITQQYNIDHVWKNIINYAINTTHCTYTKLIQNSK